MGELELKHSIQLAKIERELIAIKKRLRTLEELIK